MGQLLKDEYAKLERAKLSEDQIEPQGWSGPGGRAYKARAQLKRAKLSEDQIEMGRWKAMRLIKAHPPVDGWLKGAAMHFLRMTKQPNSQPDAKSLKRMVDAWRSFKASYQVSPEELPLVERDGEREDR